MSERTNKPKAAASVIVASLVVLASLYAGTYLWISEPQFAPGMDYFTTGMDDKPPHTNVAYRSRIGSQRFWKLLFSPANTIDRKLRPEKWPYDAGP